MSEENGNYQENPQGNPQQDPQGGPGNDGGQDRNPKRILVNISIMDAAKYIGMYLGLYMLLVMALFVYSLKNQGGSLLLIPAMLGLPVLFWYLVKNYRDRNSSIFFPFSVAWLISLLSFLMASVILSVMAYLYLRYLDHGNLMEALSAQVEAMKVMMTQAAEAAQAAATGTDATDTAAATAQTIENIDAMMENLKAMNMKQLAIQLFNSNLMWGNILSIVVAVITARNRLKIRGI